MTTAAGAGGGVREMARIRYHLIKEKDERHSKHFKDLRLAGYTFSIMAHPLRLRIILQLSEGSRYVGQLCNDLNIERKKLSACLGQLRHGGLVMIEHKGKRSYYALTDVGDKIARFVKDTFKVAATSQNYEDSEKSE